MNPITVYEMRYHQTDVEKSSILCIPFQRQYFQEYMRIYNECFHTMREALEIEPFDFLSSYGQIADKTRDIYLLMDNEEMIGSVACYGNEIDDLIVNKKFQHKGYGKQLLLWGMQRIREKNENPIILHVADWNQNALRLYQRIGFQIVKTEKICERQE